MASSGSSIKRVAHDEDGEDQPPVKQNKFDAVDESICSLHKMLLHGLDDIDEFNSKFSKLIANRNQLKSWQVSSLNESSSTGLSFLMLASKYGNIDVLEFLIGRGLNVNNQDINGSTASDYAWKNKRWGCLIKLLKADAPFPKKFDIYSLEASDKEKEIIDIALKSQKFYEMVESGSLEEVKLFVAENRKVRFAYNEKNQSALTTALISKKVKIYSFLCNNFYESGIDSKNHNIQLEKLPEDVKKKLRFKLKKHLNKPVEDHVMVLLSKSRDRSGSKENYKKLIDFYESLNKISQIRPILQIVAMSERTDIVFDFNQEGVSSLDPTTDGNPFGVTDHSGYILIGAGRADPEVLATIAHELTHWALQLVYNNECQPFNKDDNDQRLVYEELVKKYNFPKSQSEKCAEIAEVYKSYPSDQWNEELIVRVPQLLALYKDNPLKIRVFKIKLKHLFDYYEKKVLQNVERELRLFDQKKEIKEMNSKFSVLEKALESDMLSLVGEKSFDISQSLFIITQLPELALESLVKCMQRFTTKDFDAINIFVTLEQITDPKNLEILKKAAKSEIKPNLIIFSSKKSFEGPAIDDHLLESVSKLKTFYISTNKYNGMKMKTGLKVTTEFKWEDLNDETKARIMESKVIFQSSKVSFKKIIGSELLLQELPLEKLLKPNSIKLKSNTLPKTPRVFIKRFFVTMDKPVKILKSDELCDLLLTHKTVLIADLAGMGKSTSAAQLARDLKHKMPLSWVVFVDLKQHTKVFLRDNQPQPESIDTIFFSRKLLKLERTFEQKLFESFYEDKKVIFIIDGFDEISPKFKNFVTVILKTVRKSENRLLVTTRFHCAKELFEELTPKAIRTIPFSKDDQINFLTEYWKNNDVLKSCVRKLLRKIDYQWSWNNFFATPIHIFMLGEICADQGFANTDEISINIFSFYDKFIQIKLQIWNEEKGPLAGDDNLVVQRTDPATNLLQIFRRLALEQIFSADDIEKLNVPKVPDCIIDEMIARVGIVTYGSNGSAQFTHRTFAEYFVADFISNYTFTSEPQFSVVKLFAKVIVIFSYDQIKNFLNDKLESLENFETEVLARYFEEAISKHGLVVEDLAIVSLYSSFSNLSRLIFETLNFNYKVKVRLLKSVLEVKGWDFNVFTRIWYLIEKFVDQVNFKAARKELLFTKVNENNIVVEALRNEQDRNDSNRVSQLAIEHSKNLFDEDDFLKFYYDEQGKSFPFSEIVQYDDGSFEKIWEAAKIKLGGQNLKKLVLGKDKYGNTLLHSFGPDIDNLLQWLETVKEILEPEELNDHLTTRGKWDRMFYRKLSFKTLNIAEVTRFWKFIEQNASAETQRKLLLEENGEEKKIFVEVSIFSKDKAVTDCIFDITESILQNEGKTTIDLLRKRGSLTDFILQILTYSNEHFDKYSNKLSPEEFQSIILSKTSFKYNILHCLVNGDNPDLMWERIIEQINDLTEIKRLLFETAQSTGCNVFKLAAWNNDHFLIRLLDWCKSTFDHEFMKKVFTVQVNDWTLLHKVAQFGDESLNHKCLDFVTKNFDQEELREMFLQEGENKLVPIQVALENKNPGVIERVGAFYLDLFDTDQLNKIYLNMKNQEPEDPYRAEENHRLRKILEKAWKID